MKQLICMLKELYDGNSQYGAIRLLWCNAYLFLFFNSIYYITYRIDRFSLA